MAQREAEKDSLAMHAVTKREACRDRTRCCIERAVRGQEQCEPDDGVGDGCLHCRGRPIQLLLDDAHIAVLREEVIH